MLGSSVGRGRRWPISYQMGWVAGSITRRRTTGEERVSVLEPAAFRERLAQEVERAGSYERPLTVALFAVHGAGERAKALRALETSSRLVDVIGKLDDHHL